MTINDDLHALSEQETALTFSHFNHATAWELGAALKAATEQRHLSSATEAQLTGQTLFCYAMPNIADWVRHKRNGVNHIHKSACHRSAAITAANHAGRARGTPRGDYSVHGLNCPLNLSGSGCISTVSISSAPQREDHHLLVSTLPAILGLSLPAALNASAAALSG